MGIWKTGRKQGNALIIGKRYEMSQKRKWLKKKQNRRKEKEKEAWLRVLAQCHRGIHEKPPKGPLGENGGIFVGSKVSLRDAFRSE